MKDFVWNACNLQLHVCLSSQMSLQCFTMMFLFLTWSMIQLDMKLLKLCKMLLIIWEKNSICPNLFAVPSQVPFLNPMLENNSICDREIYSGDDMCEVLSQFDLILECHTCFGIQLQFLLLYFTIDNWVFSTFTVELCQNDLFLMTNLSIVEVHKPYLSLFYTSPISSKLV